jgi:hypothetical protein
MILGAVPLLVFFFAVSVSVNDQKGKNNQATDGKDDDDWLKMPYVANKFGQVRIHAH